MQATVAADTAVSSWQPSDEASEVETPLPNCKSKIATILDNDSACRERPQVLQDFEYVQVTLFCCYRNEVIYCAKRCASSRASFLLSIRKLGWYDSV